MNGPFEPRSTSSPEGDSTLRLGWLGLSSRRDLLRIGSLSIAATFWPGLTAKAWSSDHPRSNGQPPRCQSVVLLWLAGGVTHIDSFDPKPDAPEEIRGTLASIATNVPGIRFCETLPCLAQVANHLAVIRSYSHGDNDHFVGQAYALSGRKLTASQITTEPNVGSVVARLQGPRHNLPGYIAVPGTTRPGPPATNMFVGGWLGQQYAPFSVGAEGIDFTKGRRQSNPPAEIEEHLRPAALELPEGVSIDRLAGRIGLRARIDRVLQTADRSGMLAGLDANYHSAFHLLDAPQIRAAFDLSREPQELRNEYGRTKIGQRCLLARRLVEAGARFVMVDYGYDPDYGNLWDNHCAPVQNQPHICEMVKRGYHLAGVDKAFAALIADLADRGLLESTLVVFLTEFGRTPKINAQGGRDHWAAAGSIFCAGGSTRGGQVIGATDKHGANPTGRGYSPGDIAATIYHAIDIDPDTRLHDQQNRPHFVLPEGEPIRGVFG